MDSVDLDIDDSFDSPFRARSNTWPLPRPEPLDTFLPSTDDLSEENLDLSEAPSSEPSANVLNTQTDCLNGQELIIPTTAHELSEQQHQNNNNNTNVNLNGQANGPKKNSSRRNAWGNMSYADLITQAIQSSPEKRLTLSQIYDWMVQNVPYFKDKGDSNSSAGWKNSIRHNLSLHSRFMRVQNEGTGKSSWWMINPDAKPGKAARRRATSMETQKYEKKRGRVKKKIEALRNGLVLDTTPSPSSSISEGLDMFPESPLHVSFQLSPDFRPRTSSNASSCGRLSPIPAVESDLHDNQVPPVSPLSNGNWNTDMGTLYTNGDVKDNFNTEKLVEMANTMKLNGNNFMNVAQTSPNGDSLSPSGSHVQLNGGGGSYNINGFPTGSLNYNSGTNGTLHRNGSDPYFQNPSAIENSVTLTSLNSVPTPRSPSKGLSNDVLSPSTFGLSTMSPSISPSQSMDTLLSAITTTNSSNFSNKNSTNAHQTQANGGTNYNLSSGNNLITRANLINKGTPITSSSSLTLTSLGSTASQWMGHLLSLNNPMPNDLDLNFDSLHGGLECDVDQVIKHELSVDGNLDFNFDSLHGASAPPATVVTTSMASASSHSWVH